MAATGDYGVFERADGKFDVFTITASGKRETRREGIPDLTTARDIARAGLEDTKGTKLWWSHHSDPELLTPYDPFSR